MRTDCLRRERTNPRSHRRQQEERLSSASWFQSQREARGIPRVTWPCLSTGSSGVKRSLGQQGDESAGPGARAKTPAPPAGPRNHGTKGPGPPDISVKASDLWIGSYRERSHRSPSGTRPGAINPEMLLCDKTRLCPDRGLPTRHGRRTLGAP